MRRDTGTRALRGGSALEREAANAPARMVQRLLVLFLLVLIPPAIAPGTGHGQQAPETSAPAQKSEGKKKARRAPAVRFSGSFAFEVIYDDNIIHYSDEDLTEFSTMPNLGKFSITSADDWILRPRLDLVLRTSRLTGKPFTARFRYTYWRYVENEVKNNQSFQLRCTHPGFDSKDSFELTAYHSPLSYIRNFRDRAPNTSVVQPLTYTNFSYASNSLTIGYFRRWTRAIEATVDLRRSIRYYNQAFMENDNWEWNIGGNVLYRLTSVYRIRGEYDYSHVRARGADEVGEDVETSDDGDPSYERDSYRLSFEFRPRRNRYRLDGLTLSGQYQAYYFTSEKPLDEDPTHVGRKDQVYRFGIEGDTDPLLGPVSFYAGYLYTERTSTSPSGAVGEDIGEEKDYTDNRSWIGATYPLPF